MEERRARTKSGGCCEVEHDGSLRGIVLASVEEGGCCDVRLSGVGVGVREARIGQLQLDVARSSLYLDM